MRKIFTSILSGTLILSLAACGNTVYPKETARESANVTETVQDDLPGGITLAKDPAVTPEILKMLSEVTRGRVGAIYTPIAYIGSQVVAGTNHFVLCSVKGVPTATANYEIITLYENLDGKVDITGTLESEAVDDTSDTEGGWLAPKTPEVTKEAREALNKALEGFTGSTFTPLALLATQVVDGTNYSILCETRVTHPEAVPEYSIVHIYQDKEGKAEIKEMFDFSSEK